MLSPLFCFHHYNENDWTHLRYDVDPDWYGSMHNFENNFWITGYTDLDNEREVLEKLTLAAEACLDLDHEYVGAHYIKGFIDYYVIQCFDKPPVPLRWSYLQDLYDESDVDIKFCDAKIGNRGLSIGSSYLSDHYWAVYDSCDFIVCEPILNSESVTDHSTIPYNIESTGTDQSGTDEVAAQDITQYLSTDAVGGHNFLGMEATGSPSTNAMDIGTDAMGIGTDAMDIGTDAIDIGTDVMDIGTDSTPQPESTDTEIVQEQTYRIPVSRTSIVQFIRLVNEAVVEVLQLLDGMEKQSNVMSTNAETVRTHVYEVIRHAERLDEELTRRM